MHRFVWNARVAVGGSVLAAAVLIALLAWQPRPTSSTDPVPPSAGEDELVLYCAAGMAKPVEEVRQEYEQRYGVRINVSFDGSGALLGKLRSVDTPCDLFLAAEKSYLDTAVKEGLVEEIIPVAHLTPVFVVQPGNPKKIGNIADLLRKDVTVSLADPDAAAVGLVVRRIMTAAGTWEALRQRVADGGLALQGTVNKAATDVKLKAADVSVVWDATARQTGLEAVRSPELDRVKEQVTLGVANRSRRPTAALKFARYLTARDRGQQTLANHHFEPIPDADVWAERPELVLHAGAMLRPAVADTLDRFAEREGIELATQFNGCGLLVAGMKNGARPDAYFACDEKFLDDVKELFAAGRRFSANALVVVVPKGNPKQIRSVEDLTKPGAKVGIANPAKSALGEVTLRMLRKRGLEETLKGNVIADAATGDFLVNMIRARAFDAVIVYRSNALATPHNLAEHFDVVEIDAADAAVQPFAVAKDSQRKYLARRLEAALAKAQSRERFEKLGFRWMADER
jgi:molybdate transport system substrate-binding protein